MTSHPQARKRRYRRDAIPGTFGRKPHCPCGKEWNPTRRDAQEAHHAIYGDNGIPVRYYQCEHGGWHWTRKLTPTPDRRQADAYPQENH